MPGLLDVRGVSKAFGALRAVSNVSFQVAEGEIFGIAGPNGSGKSTLFNIITSTPYRADSGEIRFAGNPIQDKPPHRICHMGLARTFQRETAFDSLTLRENVVLGAVFGPGENRPGDIEARVRSAVTFVELAGADLKRRAADLSVFDRKRMMLASALVMEPRMILLDEPASGLTKPEIRETIRIIDRINQHGIAVVLIEHVLPVLLTLSRHLMVLNQGEVLVTGDPASVVKDARVVEAYLGAKGLRDAGVA